MTARTQTHAPAGPVWPVALAPEETPLTPEMLVGRQVAVRSKQYTGQGRIVWAGRRYGQKLVRVRHYHGEIHTYTTAEVGLL